MLNLKLTNGAKLDIPPNSLLMIEDSIGKGKGCNIVYTLLPGENSVDELDMTYGYVKKKWVDSGVLTEELLEVTLAGDNPRKVIFPSSFVVARRELVENEVGANTKLTLKVGNKNIQLLVKDKRDTLIGEEQ